MTVIQGENGTIYYLVTDGSTPSVKMRGISLEDYNDLELMDILEIIQEQFTLARKQSIKKDWQIKWKEVVEVFHSRNDKLYKTHLEDAQ